MAAKATTAGSGADFSKDEDDEFSSFAEVYKAIADRSKDAVRTAIGNVVTIFEGQDSFVIAQAPDDYLASVSEVEKACAANGQ